MQIPSCPYYVFGSAELSEAQFQILWAAGHAVVVTGLLGSFDIEWSPDYFIHNFGNTTCSILDCDTDQTESVTVGDFFKRFSRYSERKGCWKLKV